jgi:putative PEP-CTERM system histidine kinase
MLNWEEIDLLRTAGRQLASYIALDHAAQMLARAQQFEAYNRFVAFIMHDLKNLIAQQRLVVENAARHKGNPQFIDDMVATIENSVRRMSRLLDQLRRGESGTSARRVRLADICTDVAERCGGREPAPKLAVCDASLEVVLAPERLANVLENVVRNAQEATPARGSVRISVSRAHRAAQIEVADDGKGMDAAFVRDRLFRPFDSTKGSQGMGIGAYQAREFVRSLGGEIEVHSEPGRGTRFVIQLPLVEGSGA